MIGSHNSFSYLPPKNVWGWVTKPWGKCQSLNIKEQYNKDVRYFDIRINIINDRWHIVHNKIDYGSIIDNHLYTTMVELSKNGDVYFRIIFDKRTKPKDEEYYLSRFKDIIDDMKYFVPNVNITECITFWNWKNYEELCTCKLSVVLEKHTSVCSPWYKYILGTKWFAKKYNKEYNCKTNRETKSGVILLDYIEYGNE